jgi:hypothetical protein
MDDGRVSPVNALLAAARAVSDQLSPGLEPSPESIVVDALVSEVVRLAESALTADEAALCLEWQYAESLVYTTQGNEAFIAKLKRIAGDS